MCWLVRSKKALQATITRWWSRVSREHAISRLTCRLNDLSLGQRRFYLNHAVTLNSHLSENNTTFDIHYDPGTSLFNIQYLKNRVLRVLLSNSQKSWQLGNDQGRVENLQIRVLAGRPVM